MPQIRDYPQATTLETGDAFPFDRIGVGTMNIQASALIPTSLAFVMSAFYQGSGPPTSSLLLRGWDVPYRMTMPDTNANALVQGWGFHVQSGSLPTANFVINIALNDVLAATITVHTDGTWTYASSSGLVWIANNQDRITAIAPSVTDATMNNFFWTMTGALS